MASLHLLRSINIEAKMYFVWKKKIMGCTLRMSVTADHIGGAQRVKMSWCQLPIKMRRFLLDNTAKSLGEGGDSFLSPIFP